MPTRLVYALLICIFTLPAAFAADQPPAKILFFTKSSRFEHSVIAQKDGKPSFAEKILDEMGKRENFVVTTTKDGTAITAENLAKYDLIMFYTSGDLLAQVQKDKSPPMTAEGKTALLEAVKNGKPFIAVHNALATFDHGKTIDSYIEMIGGESIGHNAIQKGKETCVDPAFPGFDAVSKGIEITEEWYSIKNFAKDLHVILVQQPDGMQGPLYVRPPYPATWARVYGKGRVFVTSLGHKEDVWGSPEFQSLLGGGIRWALARVNADITPNIETVTPKYAEEPKTK